MTEFLMQNSWVIIVAAIWTLIWKGIVLWKAAQRDQKVWYVVLLIVNTLGILDIIYLLTAGRKPKVNG